LFALQRPRLPLVCLQRPRPPLHCLQRPRPPPLCFQRPRPPHPDKNAIWRSFQNLMYRCCICQV
jgi:hypothetical protein